MAYGIIKILPASGHVEAPLGGQAGGALYPSVKLLNPNDGVVYVARNRDCSSAAYGEWDWKVPSQSYAALPGSFNSIGMFYLDQSGAGRQGEITVYPSQAKLDDPMFVAIGRALTAVQTTLDITEGVQPANPGLGILRLWATATDFLQLLTSGGVVHTVIDSGTVLGGNLTGTLPNPNISPTSIARTMMSKPSVGTAELFDAEITTAKLQDLAVTTAKLADSAVLNTKIVDGTIATAKLAANAITRPVIDSDLLTDLYTNAAIAAGTTLLGSPYPYSLTASEATDYWLVFIQASFQSVATPNAAVMGWDFQFDSSILRRLSRLQVAVGSNVYVDASAAIYFPAAAAGAHTFTPALYSSVGQASGLYLRGASAPVTEYIHITILEVRK
jgi:hypothetical protein